MKRARFDTVGDDSDENYESDDYMHHPRVAFHREALIGDHWHVIRESFRYAYENMFQLGKVVSASGRTYKNTIAEPHKFWRHCREALAKWVLSQTARYRPVVTAVDAVPSPNGNVNFDAISLIHFLPSTEMLRSAHFHLDAADILCADEVVTTRMTQVQPHDAAVQTPARIDLPSFDEQLLRDLTFKSTDDVRSSEVFAQDVRAFISDFGLAKRCATACKDIDSAVQRACRRSGAPATNGSHSRQLSLLQPAIRRIRESEKHSAAQKRVQGDLVEVGVNWPDKGYQTEASHSCGIPSLRQTRNNVRPVLLPVGSWEKLRASYQVFGLPRDAKRFPSVPPDVAFELRAAAVALRYEHCLASGSLQLCADSALKVLLGRRGYNVMDLCASPINAFMADIRATAAAASVGSTEESTAAQGSSPVVIPRRFCSAFWDTDAFFGSMGSALQFDALRTYTAFREEDARLWLDSRSGGGSRVVESGAAAAAGIEAPAPPIPGHPELPSAPLLLTLDVPYDEDLCELLFLKLARECRSHLRTEGQQEEEKQRNEVDRTTAVSSPLRQPPWVDFVLVLPLWWDIRFSAQLCPKRFFGEAAARDTASDDRMWALIEKQSKYLHCGHEIKYQWLRELPLAVLRKSTDSATGEGDGSSSLAVFDGVFISDSYTYFCTATNQQLSGVTATEVIGISLRPPDVGSPTRAAPLAQILNQFYDGRGHGAA